MTNPNRFYVYAYLREDGTPYYIGKGTGNRINQKSGHYVNLPPKSRRIVLIEKEGHEFCLKYEAMLISFYGKKSDNTGILRNVLDGGLGSKGFKHTQAHKEFISRRLSGITRSGQMRQKMRDIAAARPQGYYKKMTEARMVSQEWIHPLHGERFCSQRDLVKEFPELQQSNLSKVVRGIIRKHKGWSCKAELTAGLVAA